MKRFFMIIILIVSCVQFVGCKNLARGDDLAALLDHETRMEQIKTQERMASDREFKRMMTGIIQVIGTIWGVIIVCKIICVVVEKVKDRRAVKAETIAKYEAEQYRIEAEQETARHKATEERKMHVAVQEVEKTRIIEMSKVLISEQMANARLLLEGDFLTADERRYLIGRISPSKSQNDDDDYTDFEESA